MMASSANITTDWDDYSQIAMAIDDMDDMNDSDSEDSGRGTPVHFIEEVKELCRMLPKRFHNEHYSPEVRNFM